MTHGKQPRPSANLRSWFVANVIVISTRMRRFIGSMEKYIARIVQKNGLKVNAIWRQRRSVLSFKNSAIGGCCKDCKERFPACHDVCAKYLQAKAEWEEHKALIREAKDENRRWNNYHYDRVTRMKKILSEKKGGSKWKNK